MPQVLVGALAGSLFSVAFHSMGTIMVIPYLQANNMELFMIVVTIMACLAFGVKFVSRWYREREEQKEDKKCS